MGGTTKVTFLKEKTTLIDQRDSWLVLGIKENPRNDNNYFLFWYRLAPRETRSSCWVEKERKKICRISQVFDTMPEPMALPWRYRPLDKREQMSGFHPAHTSRGIVRHPSIRAPRGGDWQGGRVQTLSRSRCKQP